MDESSTLVEFSKQIIPRQNVKPSIFSHKLTTPMTGPGPVPSTSGKETDTPSPPLIPRMYTFPSWVANTLSRPSSFVRCVLVSSTRDRDAVSSQRDPIANLTQRQPRSSHEESERARDTCLKLLYMGRIVKWSSIPAVRHVRSQVLLTKHYSWVQTYRRMRSLPLPSWPCVSQISCRSWLCPTSFCARAKGGATVFRLSNDTQHLSSLSATLGGAMGFCGSLVGSANGGRPSENSNGRDRVGLCNFKFWNVVLDASSEHSETTYTLSTSFHEETFKKCRLQC